MIQTLSSITEEQLDQLMQIWLDGNLEAHDFVPSRYWQDNYALVKNLLLTAQLTIFEENNKVIGFAGVEENYIAGFFVKNAYRGHGIGQAIMRHLKENYSALSLAVFEANQGAVRFYQREGFKLQKKEFDPNLKQIEYHMAWKK